MSRGNGVGFMGLCVAAGLAGAGLFIGGGIRDFHHGNRYVTVKGLVERDVKADLALWPLKTKVGGNDLVQAQKDLDQNVQKITAFLKDKGFTADDYAVRGVHVLDRKTQQYGDANAAQQLRYVVEATVFVRSTAVDKVVEASRATGELVKSGVSLVEENSCSIGPTYSFTKLNEIKPTMLAEATKNARASAEQFATDSGSRVGAIKVANQGIFSITPRDQINESGGGENCGTSDPNKKVRVVTTIDYYLQ